MTNRELDREIVKEVPEIAIETRFNYVSKERIKLQLGLDEKDFLKLKRVQDLLCQSEKRVVSLEEALNILAQEFLEKHDPVLKAERAQKRAKESTGKRVEAEQDCYSEVAESKGITVVTEAIAVEPASSTQQKNKSHQKQKEQVTLPVTQHIRVSTPAHIRHQVNLRDQRKCAHLMPDGQLCSETRWIEIHHKIPVSLGGLNTAQNLTTLCSAHHRMMHM